MVAKPFSKESSQPRDLIHISHIWITKRVLYHQCYLGSPIQLHLVLFSHSGLSDSLWCHRLQHTRLLCPALSPGTCSNSCPLNQWCHPTISSSVAPAPPALNLSKHQGLFQGVASHQVAKYWSFSISPSSEYSRLISFRIDWFDLLSVQGTLKTPPAWVWKYQFFSTQPSLWSNSYISACLLEKT